MEDDAAFTSTERRRLSHRIEWLCRKLALWQLRDGGYMDTAEHLIKAAKYGPYAVKRFALAYWDVLPEDERAKLLTKGRERWAAWEKEHPPRRKRARTNPSPAADEVTTARERKVREYFAAIHTALQSGTSYLDPLVTMAKVAKTNDDLAEKERVIAAWEARPAGQRWHIVDRSRSCIFALLAPPEERDAILWYVPYLEATLPPVPPEEIIASPLPRQSHLRLIVDNRV